MQRAHLVFELVDQVRALPGVSVLRFAEPEGREERNGETGTRRIGDRPAMELFSDYYKLKRKTDPDPQLLALFDRLYREESTVHDET